MVPFDQSVQYKHLIKAVYPYLRHCVTLSVMLHRIFDNMLDVNVLIVVLKFLPVIVMC